jgi:hypothetical protein
MKSSIIASVAVAVVLVGSNYMPLQFFDMEATNAAENGFNDYRTDEVGGDASIEFVNCNGNQVAQFNYIAGGINDVWLREEFGDYFRINDPPVSELWVNFEWRVSSTDIFNPSRGRGSKILIINWTSGSNSRRTFQVIVSAVSDGTSHRFRMDHVVCNRSTGSWVSGSWLGDYSATSIEPGRTYYLQLHIKNSTAGASDGLATLSVDGIVDVEETNFVLNDAHGDQPNIMILSPYITDSNGAANGYTQYDNVALYDSDPGLFVSE